MSHTTNNYTTKISNETKATHMIAYHDSITGHESRSSISALRVASLVADDILSLPKRDDEGVIYSMSAVSPC